jgi:hypothetical protein
MTEKEYKHQYYLKNRDEILKKRKIKYLKERDEILNNKKFYYLNNREKRLQYEKEKQILKKEKEEKLNIWYNLLIEKQKELGHI